MMTWNPFSKKDKYVLGIDIGTSSIKVVELLYRGNEVFLNNYAYFQAKEDYEITHVGPFNIIDKQIAKTLKEMFKAAGFVAENVYMSIPVSASFSTLVNMPKIPDSELEQAVIFESHKFIPVPIENVNFDWVKVEQLSSGDKIKVLTVAVPNEIINKYYRIAELMELNLVNFELETFSSARALSQEEESPILILDFGARASSISIVDRGMSIINHSINEASFLMTNIIAQGLKVSLKRAEELKQKVGFSAFSGSDGGQLTKLLNPILGKVITELDQIMESYAKDGGGKIKKIILAGGGSQLNGFAEYIQKVKRIPVEHADFLKSIRIPEDLQQSVIKTIPDFSVAIGLALRK